MPPDLDIYRSANLLVKQHGEDAPIHAAMKVDATLEKGDLDGGRSIPDRLAPTLRWAFRTQPVPV